MNLPPAQLWIGNETKLTSSIEQYLSELFCETKKEACFCNSCIKMKKRQHPNVIWVEPSNNYLVSDLEVIFSKTSFALETNEIFFFVLTKAHALGITCSNRLLKILEEPPVGYHFILLSNNLDVLLPTIRSRCLVNQLQNSPANTIQHPLLNYFFTKSGLNDPFGFDSELRKQGLSDLESKQLIDEVFKQVSTQLIAVHKKPSSLNPKQIEKVLHYVKEHMKHPPQPGGSTLFWKNFYISFPR